MDLFLSQGITYQESKKNLLHTIGVMNFQKTKKENYSVHICEWRHSIQYSSQKQETIDNHFYKGFKLKLS